MNSTLIKAFWNCGDNQIIEFALMRARLNRKEQQVVTMLLDSCLTQEETAEIMQLSVRKVQELWYSATDKLINIPWVKAYAKDLMEGE